MVKLRRPRLGDRVRQAIQILITARHMMTKERTRAVNALTALLRTSTLGLDVRNALTGAQILEVSKWRTRREALALSVARTEAIPLAQRVLTLDVQLMENERQLGELVQASEAAPCSMKKALELLVRRNI